MEELKPCPFCGTEEIHISRILFDSVSRIPDKVCVSCSGCGIGYTEETEEKAIENWNNRVGEYLLANT